MAPSDQRVVDGPVAFLRSLDEQRRISSEPRLDLATGVSNLESLFALKCDYERAEFLLASPPEVNRASAAKPIRTPRAL